MVGHYVLEDFVLELKTSQLFRLRESRIEFVKFIFEHATALFLLVAMFPEKRLVRIVNTHMSASLTSVLVVLARAVDHNWLPSDPQFFDLLKALENGVSIRQMIPKLLC